jgi:hypothetical protein
MAKWREEFKLSLLSEPMTAAPTRELRWNLLSRASGSISVLMGLTESLNQ